MATVTPASFRLALYTRMKAVPGIEFTDAQLDEAGRAAFNASFPALYVKTVQRDVAPTFNNGTGYSSITIADSRYVYKIRSSEWEYWVRGWEIDDDTTVRRLPGEFTAVDVYTIAPISYPTSSVVVPDHWLDALYTYAELTLVEILLNDYAQFRGYKPNSREGQVDEVGLQNMHTNLFNKWTRERDERALALPVGIA